MKEWAIRVFFDGGLKVKSDLEKLRNQFRDWYATVSVSEIVANAELVRKIENLERRLSLMVA